MRNGEAEPTQIAEAEGLGARVIYDGALAFGATNLMTKNDLNELVDNLAKNAKTASKFMKDKFHFSSENANVARWGVDERKKADDVSVEGMIHSSKRSTRLCKNRLQTFLSRTGTLYSAAV